MAERDGGAGTALAHWDEERFDRELMTGYKDRGGEYVLPITVAIMAAFNATPGPSSSPKIWRLQAALPHRNRRT